MLQNIVRFSFQACLSYIHGVRQVWQKPRQISPLGLTPGLPNQRDPAAILCLDQSPALLKLPGLSSTAGRALRCRSWCISQAVRAAHAIRMEKGAEETKGYKGYKESKLFICCLAGNRARVKRAAGPGEQFQIVLHVLHLLLLATERNH